MMLIGDMMCEQLVVTSYDRETECLEIEQITRSTWSAQHFAEMTSLALFHTQYPV